MADLQMPDALAERIRALVSTGESVLFAGAGTSARVGFPTWPQYMEHLASSCSERGDEAAAALIRQRVADHDYLGAATVFKTSRRIPEGERWKILAEPFCAVPDAKQLEKLDALLSLPFSAVITTNYDRVIHEVASRVADVRRASGDVTRTSWTIPLERGDGSLRGGALRCDFFVARIHGRAELPTSMILDDRDYSQLDGDDEYLDFLLDILRRRRCLFVGFSFIDPAIDYVLRVYESRFGPTFSSLHAALIPESAADLRERLLKLNIEPLIYDSAGSHADAWRAIRIASEKRVPDVDWREAAVATAVHERSNTHRLLAYAYAQSRSIGRESAVVALVQDGMVAALLAARGAEIANQSDVVTDMSQLLRLDPDEASNVVSQSLARLAQTRHVARDGDRLLHDFTPDQTLDNHLASLSRGVMDRLRVRDQVKVAQADRDAAKDIIESLFIARAWDFAAHYAGAGTGFGSDLGRVIRIMVDEQLKVRTLSAPGALEAALLDLFLSPEDREAVLLAEIGRVAFGLQLVMSSPRQALFQRDVLPQVVYLDTNVLMPAIVSGHPLRPVYTDALRRLVEAARRASVDVEVIVGQQFLNEIVSHRAIAMQIAGSLDLDNPAVLERHLLFYGATNANVFIGAYASHVGRERRPVKFNEFMQQHAPYTTEYQLARYLKDTMAISIADMRFFSTYSEEFVRLLSHLKQGYPAGRKPSVVIEHEAQQLTQLRIDMQSGRRSVFVTADNQLRRILQSSAPLHDVSSATVSDRGLVALVDVLIGLQTDPRSLTRLMWSSVYYGDEERALYDYFIRLALREYSEGMAKEMQDLARVTAAHSALEAKRDSVQLFGGSAEDVVVSAKLIDRVGDRFFENWREAVELKERNDAIG